MLGSEARYRVLRRAGPTVEVEVLSAPGLRPGLRLRLSAAELPSRRHGVERAARLAWSVTRHLLARIHSPKLLSV